ncbi:MAG TPA: glycine zipper 2TM domain-containing protein [Gemmatimonadales bacterium]|nr:glycine zipper 2TM domain-containing protein [Gemmatimonadales bacterium]
MTQLLRIARPVAVLAALAAFGMSACQKGQQASQSPDSTARNLTLAPAESSAAMRDMPEHQPAAKPAAPPRTQPPARRPAPPPAPPAAAGRPNTPARATLRLAPGARFDMAATDTISSRTAKPGDPFSARVVEDVKTASGDVIIPAGSVVNGKIADVKPAPNPRTPGTLTLTVTSITVRGNTYPIEASIDSLETVHKGRGVTSGDAAKVGVGAVAGAVLGRVIGGNKKGTIIGGVVGGIAGAGVATQTKASDIVLPAGAHIIVRLTKELAVTAP